MRKIKESKFITLIRSKQRYFDSETFTEPWIPLLSDNMWHTRVQSRVVSFACTTNWHSKVHHYLNKHDITVLHHMLLSGYNILHMQWCNDFQDHFCTLYLRIIRWGKVSSGAKWPIKLELVLQCSFSSMKQLGVFLLPPGWEASSSQGYPQPQLFTWVDRDTVSCLRTQQNVPGQGTGSRGVLFDVCLVKFTVQW